MKATTKILLHEKLQHLTSVAKHLRSDIRALKKEDKEVTDEVWSILYDLESTDGTYLSGDNELIVSNRKTIDLGRLQEELVVRGIQASLVEEAIAASKVSRKVLTIKGSGLASEIAPSTVH